MTDAHPAGPAAAPPVPLPAGAVLPDHIDAGMRALFEAVGAAASREQPADGSWNGTDPAVLTAANAVAGELNWRMGVRVTEFSRDRLAASMPVAGNRQPYGLLHGGANGVLAETLGSFHAGILAGAGRVAVGTELNCTHHLAATSGLVHGVCTPIHVGRTTMSFDITITRDDGRRTCTARLSCLVRDASAG